MNTLTQESFQSFVRSRIAWQKRPSVPIQGVSIDSRKVIPGDLFVALLGERLDGHTFIHQAIENGASAVICAQPLEEIPEHVGICVCQDTVACLQNIASESLAFVGPKILALTGSLGKTTTREYARTFLELSGPTIASRENYNSQIGLSLTCLKELFSSESLPKWFVAEMGMTEAGNISQLVKLFPPDVALVTGIHPVHIQNFPTIDDLAKAKAEIYQSSHSLISLVNKDSQCASLLFQRASGQIKTMSMKEAADYRLFVDEQTIRLELHGKPYVFAKPPFRAKHQFENLLHAMALALEGGADIDVFSSALERLPIFSRRLELVQRKGVCFINDSYNAAEASMISALEVLASSKGLKKIAVLGQMRELGAYSQPCHARVGTAAIEMCDELFCLGEECGPLVDAFKPSGKPYLWANSLSDLKIHLDRHVKDGDVVLLKGSNSNRLWEILEEGVKNVSSY